MTMHTSIQHLKAFAGFVICLNIAACHAPLKVPVTPHSQSTTGYKMHPYETEQFTWSIYTSHYYLDKGNTQMVTLEQENWMKDAEGKVVANWFGAGAAWGLGGQPMGGNARLARLPKTMRITYYDYQEDRFYQLDAELPLAQIYELFMRKTVSIGLDYGNVTPQFNTFLIGIAPQGNIVLWLSSGDGTDQVELANYRATVMQNMGIARYNTTGTYGSNGERAFPISADRWQVLSSATALEAATVEKLKSGWTPPATPYLQQRLKYPWRYRMSGNGYLLELKESQANKEFHYIGPWEMLQYKSTAKMRGIPTSTTMWFNDLKGKRHRIFIPFFVRERVAGEPDVTPIWEAFRSVFPDRKVQDNNYWPSERDMATIDVHVSDDLKTYSATLIKDDLRIAIPIGNVQFFDLAPYAHAPGQTTPPPDAIKRLLGGPTVAVLP